MSSRQAFVLFLVVAGSLPAACATSGTSGSIRTVPPGNSSAVSVASESESTRSVTGRLPGESIDAIRRQPIRTAADLKNHLKAESEQQRSVAAALSAADSRPIALPTNGPFIGGLQQSPINFYEARSKQLSDADIERYIDPRIVGSVRTQVHAILKAMAPDQRRNFASYGSGNVILSNTWED